MRWLALLPLCALTACAHHYSPEAVADPYGFWMGIWHGFVCPYALFTNLVSWLASLAGFDLLQSVEVIGRPNAGFFYYAGFLLGLMPYVGGAASG